MFSNNSTILESDTPFHTLLALFLVIQTFQRLLKAAPTSYLCGHSQAHIYSKSSIFQFMLLSNRIKKPDTCLQREVSCTPLYQENSTAPETILSRIIIFTNYHFQFCISLQSSAIPRHSFAHRFQINNKHFSALCPCSRHIRFQMIF